MKLRRDARRSRGAAAVEVAITLPVVVLILMGSFEAGRAVMTKHICEEAARAGCRVAVFENGTRSDVEDIVRTAMHAANVTDYTLTMSPDPPENLSDHEPVTVTVSINYDHVSWFNNNRYFASQDIAGACVMPAEIDGATGVYDPPTVKKTGKKGTKKAVVSVGKKGKKSAGKKTGKTKKGKKSAGKKTGKTKKGKKSAGKKTGKTKKGKKSAGKKTGKTKKGKKSAGKKTGKTKKGKKSAGKKTGKTKKGKKSAGKKTGGKKSKKSKK